MLYGDFIIRPVPVKAVLFDGSDEAIEMINRLGVSESKVLENNGSKQLVIEEMEHSTTVNVGEVIISSNGEISVISSQQFMQDYMPI